MSILSAIRQQSSSIDDLAKLPQAMIMQMAQRKQIAPEMVAPILSRKAEMIDAAAKVKALQGGVPQTSVMEQLMAQNATAEAPESSEMGVAQLPVPERQYAGGGIIAFAEGDLVNEEEDEMAEYQNALDKAVENRSYLSTLKDSLKKAIPFSLPKSYESALAERKTPETAKPVERSRGGHKYEDVVVKEAERLGIDPSLALHVLYKETGNLKNPETAKSPAGAIGVMQLMPKTAKGLGVNPLNPEENIRGGVTYLKQMYDKYQDPTLALAAYNAGPGRVDKALKSGQGLAALPRETQNYIRMAEGGEVQRFVSGGQPKGLEDLTAEELEELSKPYFGAAPSARRSLRQARMEELQNKALGYQHQRQMEEEDRAALPLPPAKRTSFEPVVTAAPAIKTSTDEDTGPYVGGKTAAKPTAAEPTPEESRYAAFFKGIESDRAALAKQRAEDKNMALLAAGLGMLGGESPYAFTNIGKGGLSGVSYLSEANKQRAAEKAALDKAYVTGLRYQELGDIAKAGKESTIALRQGELNERIRNNNLLAVKSMRDDARAMAIAGLKQQGLIGMDLEDPNVAAKIDAATKQILLREPAFAEAYKNAYGIDFGKMQSSAMPSNVIKYDKKGKEIK